MNCPTCGIRLHFIGYCTKARDWRWWCPLCDEDWYHATLQDLRYERRANERVKWAAPEMEKETEK